MAWSFRRVMGRPASTLSRNRGSELKGSATVVVSHFNVDRPLNFTNDVIPVLTKFGCNDGRVSWEGVGAERVQAQFARVRPGGGPRGLVYKAQGRGFPGGPGTLAAADQGDRTDPSERGRKLDADSAAYKMLLRWVVQGTDRRPRGPAWPASRVLPRPEHGSRFPTANPGRRPLDQRRVEGRHPHGGVQGPAAQGPKKKTITLLGGSCTAPLALNHIPDEVGDGASVANEWTACEIIPVVPGTLPPSTRFPSGPNRIIFSVGSRVTFGIESTQTLV